MYLGITLLKVMCIFSFVKDGQITLPSSHFYEMLHRKVQKKKKKIELKDRWKLGIG